MSNPSLTGVKQFTCDCNAYTHCYLARLARHQAKNQLSLTTKAKLWLMILTAHRKTALRNQVNNTVNIEGITYYFYADYPTTASVV